MQLEQLVKSTHERVVAVEPAEDQAILFLRKDEKIEKQAVPFRPFMLLSNPALLAEADIRHDLTELSGGSRFNCLCQFTSITDYLAATKELKKSTGFSPSAPNAPYRIFSDLVQQILMSCGFRLFRGMKFNEIRRFQFDIETLTTPGFEFPNADRPDDKITIISMSDNTGWSQVIHMEDDDEKDLLKRFVALVQERDPDVMEGHNIFRFDLPFIETRAKRHKVALNLGREGKKIKRRPSRFSAAERTINYTRYDIYGRHVVDTYHLVQLYDVIHRELEGYGLKTVAKHFGVAAPDRTYVDGSEISALWEKDREQLLAYAADDAHETQAISNILSPSYFYQTQLIPISYQNCIVRGNATRIDSMLVSAYLDDQASIPTPEMGRPYSGALTKAFVSGVYQNVWHCDVRSLYPSIILAEKWCPSRDSLSIFPKLLDRLREFRLQAKDAERAADSAEEKDQFNALQTTFKILINSFYGYLGFGQGTFNDYEMAEKVTSRGRDILTTMLEFLEKEGATVIETDTDGIYFQPPEHITEPAKMEAMVQSVLPEGIDVELDSTYPAMFSYKSKNYALLGDNGEVSITGAALKSRGLEPFQREYISQVISLLLHGKDSEIPALNQSFEEAIENRSWPLRQLAKSETLNDSVETYRKKMDSGKGRRSAAYELAMNSERDYRPGDQVSFYVTGEKKRVSVVDNSQLLADAPAERNENVAYYLGKLSELSGKFSEFITENKADDSNVLGLDFSS